MICVGTTHDKDWCTDIVKAHAPKDAAYFCFVREDDKEAFDTAHDIMLGLTVLDKGSGVMTIKTLAPDFFFNSTMVGFFV